MYVHRLPQRVLVGMAAVGVAVLTLHPFPPLDFG